MSKKGGSKNNAFFVFVFCWINQKRKYERMAKDNFKKGQENSVFGVVMKKKGIFC